jgi:hypothetical protein
LFVAMVSPVKWYVGVCSVTHVLAPQRLKCE